MATTTEKGRTAVVKWKGEVVTITFRDVKALLCPNASDTEAAIFLRTCQSLNLNPFANEIYLIKYGEKDRAATVIAIESYLKSAEANDKYAGHEAGIILQGGGGKLEFREGSFILPDEADKVVGAWAKVYRKDREKPFYMAVNKAECLRYTKDGHLTKFWAKEQQPMMLRKTGLKRALVEAFPSLFSGTVATVETDYDELPDGTLPPAYEKNGDADWKLWWVRQKERGLTEEDVHRLLNVASLKEDWIAKGRTLEEAQNVIDNATTKPDKTEDADIAYETVRQALKPLYERHIIGWSTDGILKKLVALGAKLSPDNAVQTTYASLPDKAKRQFVARIIEATNALARPGGDIDFDAD